MISDKLKPKLNLMDILSQKKLINCAKELVNLIEISEIAEKLIRTLEGIETRYISREQYERKYENIVRDMISIYNKKHFNENSSNVFILDNSSHSSHLQYFITRESFNLNTIIIRNNEKVLRRDYWDLKERDNIYKEYFTDFSQYGLSYFF